MKTRVFLFGVLILMSAAGTARAEQWKTVYGEDGFFVWTDYAVDQDSLKGDNQTVDFRMRETVKVSRHSLEPLNTYEHRVRIDCKAGTAVVLESSSTRDSLKIGVPYRVDDFPGDRVADYVCE